MLFENHCLIICFMLTKTNHEQIENETKPTKENKITLKNHDHYCISGR